MTLSYNKTWEVMNGLEEAFNRIGPIQEMISALANAVNNDDQEEIVELTNALSAYMPVYIRQYEKASQRAWNNTVGEVRKEDNPYHVTENELEYDEVLKYLQQDETPDYSNIDLDLS